MLICRSTRILATNSRCYSTKLPLLPPITQWAKQFGDNERSRRHRVCLANAAVAEKAVETWFPRPGKRPKTVIEAYSGPGFITQALLRQPPESLGKIIVLEDISVYYEKVKELEKYDPRVTVLNMSPLSWDTYTQLEFDGLLPESQDWQEHSDLEFICQLPNSISGEQFMSQILRAIPDKSWIYKYGRTKLHISMINTLYSRIRTKPGSAKRGKLGIVADATTQFKLDISSDNLKPYENYFWPPPTGGTVRKSGQPMVLTTFTPLQAQIIEPSMMDTWDYVLRRLFVLKRSELRKALPSLAPGASNLIRYLSGPDVPSEDAVDPRKLISDLTVQDWTNIVKAFNRWPFAPKDLSIGEFEDM